MTLITSIKKIVFVFLPIISAFALVYSFTPNVAFAQCNPGEYECQGGTMCCTGHGCPSSYCDWGTGGEWVQGSTQCCTRWYECATRTVGGYYSRCTGRRKVCDWATDSEYLNKFMEEFSFNKGAIAKVIEGGGYTPPKPKPKPQPSQFCYFESYTYQCWIPPKSVFSCQWITKCKTMGKNTGDTCRYNTGGGGGGCTGSNCGCTGSNCTTCTTAAIGTRLLTNDLSATSYQTTQSISFSWGLPQSLSGGTWTNNWGTACPSNATSFDLYIDGVKYLTVGGGTQSGSVAASALSVGSHSWYVIASNGSAGTVQSSAKTFSVVPPSGSVEGYIWDSTGNACTYASKDAKEIQAADITGSISPTLDTQSGTWDPSQSGKSYTISNVSSGNNKVLCASIPAPKDKPGFKYSLSCLNGSASGVFSGSCAYIDVSSFPVKADLGYKLSSSGWYQVLGGDVYAGCSSCIDSVSFGIPATADILGGFSDTFIAGTGALFANSDVSVKDPSGAAKITSNSGNKYYGKNMSDGKFWPEGFSFSAPSNAESISSNCSSMFTSGSLNPDKVYKADINCVQSGVDGVSSSYKLSKDGVAVVFVTGGNTLTFDKDFKSEGSKKRIIFITEGGAEVSKNVGYASPTSNSDANIQASIIAKQSIKLLSGGSSADTTLVMEGPLASKDGNVDFMRDRGLSNAYPASVIKFNPIYLSAMNSGVGEVSISWVINN